MQGISIKAVLLATLAVFGIDFISGALLANAFHLPLDATQDEFRAAVAQLNHDPGYLLAALALGTASTVAGGYLTTRLAHTLPYFNALAFGVLAVIISIPMSSDLPTSWRVFGLALTIPAALAGAYISKLLARQRPK